MASPFFVRPVIRAEPPLSSQFDLAALPLMLAALFGSISGWARMVGTRWRRGLGRPRSSQKGRPTL
ncbi:hypothetical protein ATO4_16430 [Aurantimonas sp. 22II-16-19i]|nr:hypothetical protein ATO4_16430 [Aurantimonas sp. 22II-16-19i]